jgi:hypothetical protein
MTKSLMRSFLCSVLAVEALELRMQYETPLRNGGLDPKAAKLLLDNVGW